MDVVNNEPEEYNQTDEQNFHDLYQEYFQLEEDISNENFGMDHKTLKSIFGYHVEEVTMFIWIVPVDYSSYPMSVLSIY